MLLAITVPSGSAISGLARSMAGSARSERFSCSSRSGEMRRGFSCEVRRLRSGTSTTASSRASSVRSGEALHHVQYRKGAAEGTDEAFIPPSIGRRRLPVVRRPFENYGANVSKS